MNTYDPNFIPKKSFALVGQKAVILNSENKILLLQRSEKSGSGGKWSLPGGALEYGEEPFEAVRREISEEISLTVSQLKLFHVKSYTNEDDFVVIIGYTCVANSEDITLNWEHDSYQWLTKEDALKLDLTNDGRTFIECFKE